jgi:hypothetical protein
MNAVILDSTLTCPHCGHAETETMPTMLASFSMIASPAEPCSNQSKAIAACFALTVRSNAHPSNSINLVAPGDTTILMG